MLFNTSDTWPQQKSSENKSTRRNANQQQQQNPIQNMSPNELYGALLQYHLHQQQQQMINSQDLFMQQQQQQQQTLLMQDDGNKSLQQYQMMQRAAQMAAAHQQLMTNNNKNELNSPASSTSSSQSNSHSTEPLDDLTHVEEIRKSQRKEDILKNIITNSDNTGSNKRPHLKFSMDSILGNGDRSNKKICRGLQSPSEESQESPAASPNFNSKRQHKSPKSSDQLHNPYRIQLNYNFMNHPQSSSQRPSPHDTNNNNSTDQIEHQAKLSQIQQQQQQQNLVIAAAKNQQNQFQMGKNLTR